MKPVEEKLTRFLRGNLFVSILVAVALAVIWSGVAMGDASVQSGGYAGKFSGISVVSDLTTARVSSLVMLVTMSLMWLVNRFFNVLRTTSKLYLGLFALMAAASPGAMGAALNGPLLGFAVMLSLVVMYTTYNRGLPTRRIFLVFALMGAGAAFQWSYAAFMPMFLLGCGQMRCLTVRSLLAAGVGMLTPLWILWGFGLITLRDAAPLAIGWPTADVLSGFSSAGILTVVTTLVTAVVATLYNTIRVYGFNAQTRAFNGIFATLTLWTAALTAVDLGHAVMYMPLLTALTAMQATLFFRINIERRGYILVIALTLIYFMSICLQIL